MWAWLRLCPIVVKNISGFPEILKSQCVGYNFDKE